MTALHTFRLQSFVWHSALRSQALLVGSLGVHAEPLQKSSAGQSLSVVQAVPPQVSVVTSHTPDTHTRAPTSVVQVVTWVGEDGNGSPLGILSWHRPVPPDGASHHCVDMQSVSSVQPVVHKPFVVLQTGSSLGQSVEVLH